MAQFATAEKSPFSSTKHTDSPPRKEVTSSSSSLSAAAEEARERAYDEAALRNMRGWEEMLAEAREDDERFWASRRAQHRSSQSQQPQQTLSREQPTATLPAPSPPGASRPTPSLPQPALTPLPPRLIPANMDGEEFLALCVETGHNDDLYDPLGNGDCGWDDLIKALDGAASP